MVFVDEMQDVAERAWGVWQGWGVAGWLILGLVALVLLRRYLMRAVRRRVRRMAMTAAMAAYLGGGAATLSIGDYIGPAASEHCAQIAEQVTSVANLPASAICAVRGIAPRSAGNSAQRFP